MTETEVVEMVCDVYWGRLPDGSMPVTDEAAVQMVAEYAGVSRGRAYVLLLRHSPSARETRRRTVTRVAGLYIAGVIDRDAAMQTLLDETGMSLGWCAAALADAVEDPRGEHGRWTA